ncbi:L domain-like protein, partial [Dioscorea alata]
MWMALGLIQPQGRKSMEDIGYGYFDDLVSRSFFEAQNGSYFMHDAIHELARSIAAVECVRLEDDRQNTTFSKKARHSLFSCSNTMDTSFEQLYGFKSLRTLLVLEGYKPRTRPIPNDLFLKLKFLRVLDLQRRDIDKLPSSIENLQQLRYLCLSRTGIKALPSSLTRLRGLEMLKLKYCTELSHLPVDVTNLINLRHLEVNSSLILDIARIGKLTHLQKLAEFLVRRSNGFRITELKHMVELRGHLRISGLENVTSGDEAVEAMLSAKSSLSSLELVWCNESLIGGQSIQQDVLRGLHSHVELRELIIKGYSGFRFPGWLGSSSLSSLHTIQLSNCNKCMLLPPLGQLPFLKRLDIDGLLAVTHIGQEILGQGEIVGFPSLNVLVLQDMPYLVEWSMAEGQGVLPCITEIQVSECPKLRGPPPVSPTVNRLTISEAGLNCLPQLKKTSTTTARTALSSLYVYECSSLKSLSNGLLSQELSSLRELTIANCEELVSLPMDGFKLLVSLKNLHIYNCPKLKCGLPEAIDLLPESLEDLRISSCSTELINPILKCLSRLTSLTHLNLTDCSQLNHFPEEAQLPNMLKFLVFWNCANLWWLPPLLYVSGLESLVISNCPSVSCLPEEGLPAELQELCINGCPLLIDLLEDDSGREWDKIAPVSKVEID